MGINKIKILAVIVIIGVVGVFYLSTVREGHGWGGDFSMYIQHAKNIAEGIEYKNSGYIYNPFNPYLGPKTYPPVFPLLLSPIYKWFGLNLTAMKIEVILTFLVFLLTFFLVFRGELAFGYLAAVITVIGLNPYFWGFKDNVLPDTLFVLLVYLSLMLIQRAYRPYKSRRSELLYAVLVGVLVYLSYGTRSLGIVLVPCIVIYEIIRFKRLTRFAVAAILVSILFAVLQGVFLHSERSYFDQFAISPEAVFYKILLEASHLCDLWDNGYNSTIGGTLFLIISALAVAGYAARIKKGVTIFEIFVPLYLGPLIIWPRSFETRYLIPVIPLYVFYAFVGIKQIRFFQRHKIEEGVFVMLVAAIFASYAGRYSRTSFGPIGQGVAKKESVELFEYIKENTSKRDVFIFRKPRVLSVFAGRRASVYHTPSDDKELWDWLRTIGATYIVAGKPFYEDRMYLRGFIERYKGRLEEVYSNPDFRVYRIKNF